MKKFIQTLIAVTFLVLTACNSSQRSISEAEFGENWPFVVKSGSIECLGPEYIIIFESSGRSYALNDAARATHKYEDISVIVKADENYPGGQVKMDMSIIEFEALKLCDQD